MDFVKRTLKEIKKNEGFSSLPYIDHLVAIHPTKYGIAVNLFKQIQKIFPKLKVTFGYGFTYITQDEAEVVLEMRLYKYAEELREEFEWFDVQPDRVKSALLEMRYQLGLKGLKGFKKMLKAIEEKDYERAYREALDSAWANQTPIRAKSVARRLNV